MGWEANAIGRWNTKWGIFCSLFGCGPEGSGRRTWAARLHVRSTGCRAERRGPFLPLHRVAPGRGSAPPSLTWRGPGPPNRNCARENERRQLGPPRRLDWYLTDILAGHDAGLDLTYCGLESQGRRYLTGVVAGRDAGRNLTTCVLAGRDAGRLGRYHTGVVSGRNAGRN